MSIDELVEVESSMPMSQALRHEIDAQVSTARAYPRSVQAFRQECLALATLDDQVAEECMYAIPRDGKSIEGPSARLAEIVVSAYGNCRAGARIVDEGERFVTAQGVFMDVQRNIVITFEARRRITDRHGRRYSDDMIAVTANAACSIALRNAVFKGVPKALWSSIYDAVREKVAGSSETLPNRRAKAMLYLQKLGATESRILAALRDEKGQPLQTVDQITMDHLTTLKGTATAIRDGETTVEQAFPDPNAASAAESKGKGTAGVKDKLAKS